MRKKILITLAVLAAILLVLAAIVAMQPADYTVTRSTTISAPASAVFAQVNDFHNWDNWSPWAKLDPDSKATFEGPASGEGAIFKWSGNDQIGEGKMTILQSKPNELIKIKLEFVRPFEDTSQAQFDFKSQGDQTAVSWSMSGHKNFISKAVCMFMDMDKLLGGEFEKGLDSLKQAAQTPATPAAPATPATPTDKPSQP